MAIRGANMTDHGTSTLKEKAAEELKSYLILAAYLFICLGALQVVKGEVMHDAGITYVVSGVAIVKALVLAKFILLGDLLPIGKSYKLRPLIWRTGQLAILYLVVLVLLTLVEEAVIALIHARPVEDALRHAIGPTQMAAAASILMMFLILLPYCAYRSLIEAVGVELPYTLFFRDRSVLNAALGRPATAQPTGSRASGTGD
jgi:hypothetical protein